MAGQVTSFPRTLAAAMTGENDVVSEVVANILQHAEVAAAD